MLLFLKHYNSSLGIFLIQFLAKLKYASLVMDLVMSLILRLAIIGLPTGIVVDWACPDSVQLSFNAVTGAAGYTGYVLGSKYMEIAGSSTTNTMVLYGVNPFDRQLV